MVQKLYGAFLDLFSGFAELSALGMAITLLLWVSGLFFGLAFMSVFVSLACVYVLAVSIIMHPHVGHPLSLLVPLLLSLDNTPLLSNLCPTLPMSDCLEFWADGHWHESGP